VKIEIPKVLLKLRSEVTEAKQREGSGGVERWAFRVWAWLMTHPKTYRLLARVGATFFPVLPKIGPLRSWTSQRELPRLALQSFQKLWAERRRP
jgi:L-lactate dehydrogenase complex protein LldF